MSDAASSGMTEDQIERAVERRMDVLDRQYMAGEISATQYDLAVCELDEWAADQLARREHVDLSAGRMRVGGGLA